MTTPKSQFTYKKADGMIAAFDEWLEEQTQPVRDTVRNHIALLTKSIPNIGEKSTKILLAGVYLRVREVTRLPGPIGAEHPVLVIVEDAK